MARAKHPKDEDPNKLKRQVAGRYATSDGRFVVEGESTGSWYLVDNERENELGLPLMEGPLATLDDARERLVAAREGRAEPAEESKATAAPVNEPRVAQPRPTLRSVPGGKAHHPPATGKEHEPGPDRAPAGPRGEPKPRRRVAAGSSSESSHELSWLERLSPGQQAEARRLLAILERLGIDDPALVRREIEANLPEVARALLARRVQREAVDIWREPASVGREVAALPKNVRRHLRPLVEPALEAAERVRAGKGSPADVAAFARLVAIRTAAAVFDAIDTEGHEARLSGEPGWRLVELDGRREPTKRAITLDQSDLLEPGGG